MAHHSFKKENPTMELIGFTKKYGGVILLIP